MTSSDPPVDSFLNEFKASLSEPTGEAVLRRINAERLLYLLADELVESHQAERIRVLPDSQLAGEAGADFLVQVDDYDIRLELMDAPGGGPRLSQDKLRNFAELLEDNPNTVALVVVWTTDDLQAIPLSVADIRHLLEHPDSLSRLMQEAKALPEVLKAIIARQTKLWEVGLAPAPRSAVQPPDIRLLFERAIGAAIEAERDRSYRYTERRLAADLFPVEEERRLIFQVLKQALEGGAAGELATQLTRLPRRGAK
jgi:hypothetical protein